MSVTIIVVLCDCQSHCSFYFEIPVTPIVPMSAGIALSVGVLVCDCQHLCVIVNYVAVLFILGVVNHV